MSKSHWIDGRVESIPLLFYKALFLFQQIFAGDGKFIVFLTDVDGLVKLHETSHTPIGGLHKHFEDLFCSCPMGCECRPKAIPPS